MSKMYKALTVAAMIASASLLGACAPKAPAADVTAEGTMTKM
jgi:hypothetical protein